MVHSLQIRRTAGALGAEISGVDLSQDLPDTTIAAIRQALVEHQVIFFRDQDLTPARQVAFGARFGPLNIHPYVAGMAGQPEVMEIIKEPSDRINFGGGWHSDMSFLETPAIGSILYAVELPEWGGDTLFASQAAAFEALSPGLRATLEGLSAVHSASRRISRLTSDCSSPSPNAAAVNATSPCPPISPHTDATTSGGMYIVRQRREAPPSGRPSCTSPGLVVRMSPANASTAPWSLADRCAPSSITPRP